MNAGSRNDNQAPLPEENDPLWQLLGSAPMAEPNAWFTVRTMAQCQREARKSSVSFGAIWRWVLGGGLGICLAVGLAVTHVQTDNGSTAKVEAQNIATQKVAPQQNVQEAFEIMASIDNSDTDSSSSSPWQDSSR